MCALILRKNNQIHYDLMVIFVCLHFTLPQYRYYVGVSEDIELLKCLPCTLECMSKIKSILSIIVHALYGAVCIQFTHVSYDVCEIMCTLSYWHHQIGSVIHLPLLMGRSWNNGMRCMSFYIFMITLGWSMKITDGVCAFVISISATNQCW